MNNSEPASAQPPDADLSKRRLQIRHGLKRANLAAVAILIVVLALSLGAVLEAIRAERNAHEAELSRRATERELERTRQTEAQALLQQSRAERRTGEAGQRSESLAAVARAAALQPSAALRDEAIAVLALPDLRFVPIWTNSATAFFQFSPSLTQFAVAGPRGEISLRSTQDAKEEAQLPSVGAAVRQFWFSPNGQFLAVDYWSGSNVVWGLPTGNPVLSWGPGYRLTGFGPESDCVFLFEAPDTLRCLGVADGRERWHCQSEPGLNVVSVAPQGPYFAVNGQGAPAVQVRSLATGELVRQIPSQAAFAGFVWNADGQRLVIGRDNGWVEVWDGATGMQITAWRAHEDAVVELRFDPLGRWLTTASWDRRIRFWSLSDFRLVMSAVGYQGHFVARFSPDGTRFACATGNTLGLLEPGASPVLGWFLVPPSDMRGSWSIDISPEGKLLAAGYRDGFRVWDLAAGRQVASELFDDCRSVLFTPNSEGLVTCGAAGLAYRPLERPPLVTEGAFHLGPSQILNTSLNPVFFAALTPDGRWVAAANRRAGRLDVYEVQKPTNYFALGPHPGVQFVAASSDGQWLASGTWKGRGVKVWSIATRSLVADLPVEGSAMVTFSPDSRLLVTSIGEYRAWECGSWRECYRAPGVGADPHPCAFSPKGNLLAILRNPHVIELREPSAGRVLAALEAPGSSSISSLRFTPDSTKLVALEWARQIQVWDLPRIHTELAKLGLDWDETAAERTQPEGRGLETDSRPARAAGAVDNSGILKQARPGSQTSPWFYTLPLSALVLGVAIALYTLRYHQRMMQNYEEVESLATERNHALHAAQAELLHSQKMRALGTLAAGIAHDFNNLLSIIRMGNNFLRRHNVSAEEKAESGQAVERAVEQGKQIVRSMLGYSREPADEDEPYSVLDLVNEAGLLLNQQFLRGITLTLELNRELPLVTGRRGRLQQILLNLMVNASEAMNGKGRLRIAARLTGSPDGEFVLRPGRAPHYIELLIEDTGPGMDSHIQDRVFEPFFSTKPRGASSGTGLGLSLVHSLAEQEKIGVRLESAPGRGTVFTLWIPVIGSEEVMNRDTMAAGRIAN